MPIIRDYETTEVLTAVGSITVTLPVHATNDLLLVFVGKDTTVGGTLGTPAGWTKGGAGDSLAGGAARGAWYYQIAASGSVTNPNITSSDTDEWHAVAISIRNVNTSSPINANDVSASDNSMPWAGTTVTTTVDNCLVFHSLFCDQGNAPAVYPAAGVMNLSNQDAGTVSVGVAWEFKRTAGTTTARDWYGRTNDDARIFTVAIADDGNNTEVPGYLDPSTSSCTLIHGFQGITDNPTGNTYPTSTLISPIGGIVHAYDAAAAVNDTGVNPYQTSTSLTPASTTQTQGFRVTLASAQALTSGHLLGTYLFGTPRELIDLGKFSTSGILFITSDASNDYKAWVIGAKDSVTTSADARVNYAIQIDQATATTFANSGTLNNITDIQISARMSTGTFNCLFNMLVLVNKVVIAGGTSTYPLDFEDVVSIANTNLIPMIEPEGSMALCWAPFQIGGGSDPVNIVVDLKVFQYPEAYNASEIRLNWHVDPNQVGFDFAGVSGDTIKFTNCLFTSETVYYWTINSAATSAATWDFSGTTIVNGTVTLRNVMTFDSMTFVNCPSIDISSCTINNCNISGAPAAGSGLTVNSSSSITYCEINTTTVSAGNSFMSTATPEDISTTAFTGSTSTGHAIRLTATGTFAFAGNTFTNYGPTRRTFNTGTGVNSSTDVVTLDADHGYSTGASIYYQKQGGTAAIGLTDSTLYYVRSIASNQLAFFTSAANAIADTSRINLTSSGTETHEINSSSAAIYNNSGGLVTLNLSGGVGSPSYRNGAGSTTVINNNVNVDITVQDTSANPIIGAQVAMYKTADDSTLISSTPTNASGLVSSTVAANSGAVYIRVRQSTATATFATTSGVNGSTEVITTDIAHSFVDGEAVVYSKNGGSASVGLTEATTYYVNSITSYTLSLHTSATNAIADTSRVNLTASGSETHLLDPIRYIPNSTVGSITTDDFAVTITMIEDTTVSG